MHPAEKLHGLGHLRLTSSGSKVIIQLMMFIVVGILPVLFPRWIHIANHHIVFPLVSAALVSSLVFELARIFLEKSKKSTTLLLNLQLLASVILLAPFLHYFGYINGPFFVLYLLTVMESFLNLNPFYSFIIASIMITTTAGEFIWLASTHRIALSFISILECLIRVLSIVFISSYGYVLARKTIAEENSRAKLEKTTSKLDVANQHLKELDNLKDEFVSLASHELRTPMTAIKSYVWMIQNNKAGDITPTTRDYLNIVYQSTERLIHLVNDMLDISRIESGKFQLHPEPFNFSDLVFQIQAEFNAKASERHMEWSTTIDPLVSSVTADRDKVLQILENLIGNAFKFTPDGGTITLNAYLKNNRLVVDITDTGKGIAAADIPKLFTKFTRLGEGLTAYSQPGTGLGLYLCKQFVELHHGNISVQSVPGQGSTFTFSLPLSNIT